MLELGEGIPGTGEPGGLPSIGLHRVKHDWSALEAAEAAAGYSEEPGHDWLGPSNTFSKGS